MNLYLSSRVPFSPHVDGDAMDLHNVPHRGLELPGYESLFENAKKFLRNASRDHETFTWSSLLQIGTKFTLSTP